METDYNYYYKKEYELMKDYPMTEEALKEHCDYVARQEENKKCPEQ